MNSPTVLLISLLSVATCHAFDRYIPYGATTHPVSASSKGLYNSIKPSDRVVLPGLRSRPAELLQQTLEQRYRRTLASDPSRLRNQAVSKIFSDSPSFARARGIYAELWFVDRNPHVGLVSSRNATQMDAYARPVSQKPPVGIQIKTLSGGPSAYAAAMLDDYRAPQFVIPDDHVEGVRNHWKNLGDQLQDEGLAQDAKRAYRQMGRVRGLGITMPELEAEMRTGGRHLLRESSARYVSYGAAVALAIAPAVVQAVDDGYLSDKTMLTMGRGMAFVGTAAGMDAALSRVRNGALRGGLRGNAITAAALLVVDTGFSIYEFGGRAALSDPRFYERVGGSVGATAAGLTVGTFVGVWTTGAVASTGVGLPFAVPAGAVAGFLSGTAAGIAGHIGGTGATRWILSWTAKDMLMQYDLRPVISARTALESQIVKLQEIPPLDSPR